MEITTARPDDGRISALQQQYVLEEIRATDNEGIKKS